MNDVALLRFAADVIDDGRSGYESEAARLRALADERESLQAWLEEHP
jgi:hypothetical protein